MTAELIRDLPFDEYLALPGTNWSRLGDLRTSARLYRHRDDHPRPDTAALKLGRTAHHVVLQPELTDRYVVYRGPTTGKGSRTQKKQFEEDADALGKTVLSVDDYDACLAMRGSCIDNPDTVKVLAALTERELSVQWTHPSGERCKSRLDGVIEGAYVVDFKTTRQESLRKFFEDAARLGYHCQLGMYQDAWAAVSGERLPALLLVAQSVEPFDSWVCRMPDEVLQVGRAEYEECMSTLQQCRASGHWPGLASGPVDFELPAWAMKTDDDPTGLGLDWGETGTDG